MANRKTAKKRKRNLSPVQTQREFKLKSRRSLKVLEYVRRYGPISIPQMRERWQNDSGEEVSEKTIQRDVHHLRDRKMAPLEYDESRKGWFLTDHRFRLESFQMTDGELFALIVAERAVDSIKSAPLARRVEAIFQRICHGLESAVSVDPNHLLASIDFTAERGADIDEKLIMTLNKAIVQKQCVEMDYTTAEAKKTKHRVVHPYHLRCHHGDWYLVGRYHGTENVPILALTRMRNVRLGDCFFDEKFDPKDYFKDAFGFEVTQKTYQVKILFSQKAAFYIREKHYHSEEQRQERRDGSLVLSFPTRRLEEIQRWVLGWGGEAKVLGPKSLVEAVRGEAGNILKHYR